MFETIDYSVTDGVAEICLSRPARHNAVNAQMNADLPAAWEAFNADPNAIVAIITGAGEKAFCTGADIADLPELDLSSASAAMASMRWTSQQNSIWKPVICAVNGMTIGGGLHFIADSDIVIAADNATFFDTHVNVGLVAGLEPVGLVRRMPMEAVLRMALLGGNEKICAQRALHIGLVGEVVSQQQLLPRAYEVAAMMTSNSPAAMARTKKAIWAAKNRGLDDALSHAWQLIIEHNKSADYAEGTNAFLEGRAPRWQPWQSG